MKSTLTLKESQKLIRLGYEPIVRNDLIACEEILEVYPFKYIEGRLTICDNYTLADILDMLPQSVSILNPEYPSRRGRRFYLSIIRNKKVWRVFYNTEFYSTSRELISAVYKMLLKIKEDDNKRIAVGKPCSD